MSILGRYRQQPGEKLKRVLDLDQWLEDAEVISTVTASVSPTTDTPLTVSPILIDAGGKKFAYYPANGEDGNSYLITFTITTQTQIRKDEVEIEVEEVN